MRASSTVEPDTLDYTDAHAVVANARDELATGDNKKAAQLLTDAAYLTRNPEIERQVRELAAQGLEGAGRFGKGPWKEIIRIVDSLQAFRNQGQPPR
jgi:hypothetical protein